LKKGAVRIQLAVINGQKGWWRRQFNGPCRSGQHPRVPGQRKSSRDGSSTDMELKITKKLRNLVDYLASDSGKRVKQF
jgi:hypothetical protein